LSHSASFHSREDNAPSNPGIKHFDTVGVPPLLEGLAFDALIADKAFDSNAIIAELDARGRQGGHLPTSPPRKASR
jgi:hypothetical protein